MLNLVVDFPAEAARQLVRIYREGKLVAEPVEAFQAVWTLASYAAFMKLDPRAPKATYHNTTIPTTDADVISYLEDYLKPAEGERKNLPFDNEKLAKWCIEFANRMI